MSQTTNERQLKPCEFDGETYVAYSDLSGFKRMQEADRDRAAQALERLCQFTREILDNRKRLLKVNVTAIGISDCIISWASDRKLGSLISFLRQLHSQMIRRGYLICTTIAYGDFCCRESPPLANCHTTHLAGRAYTLAYSENGNFEPGMIVLLKASSLPCRSPSTWQWHLTKKTDSCEYFWSARHEKDVQRIERERIKARVHKYRRLIEIYRGKIQPVRTAVEPPIPKRRKRLSSIWG